MVRSVLAVSGGGKQHLIKTNTCSFATLSIPNAKKFNHNTLFIILQVGILNLKNAWQ